MRRLSFASVAAIWLLVSLSGLIACHATSTAQSRSAPGAKVENDVHVIRSEKLRIIMRQMELIMYDRMQSDLELDKQRMRRAEEIAVTAGELAAAASAISRASPYATLDDAERRRFDALAIELQRDAVELERLAREGQLVASAAQFERLSHACAACHSIYRAR